MNILKSLTGLLVDQVPLFKELKGSQDPGSGPGDPVNKMPPPEVPPTPAPDFATALANIMGLQSQGQTPRRRRGRAATLLTGDLGAGLPTTAAKYLTGE